VLKLEAFAGSGEAPLWIAHAEDWLPELKTPLVSEAFKQGQDLRKDGDGEALVSLAAVEDDPPAIQINMLATQVRALRCTHTGLTHELDEVSGVVRIRAEGLAPDLAHNGLELLPRGSQPNRLLQSELLERTGR
jgi:hypothetical protein